MFLVYLTFSLHLSPKYSGCIMWYAAVLRFIRRRIVLAIIFATSLTYCIVSFLREGSHRNMGYQDIAIERKPFVWRTLQEHNETNDSITCRNSVQGKFLLADDRGYVCHRRHLMRGGCCNPDAASTTRYSCESCRENNCCIIYEYCVSCCLDPGKKDLLELLLAKLSAEEKVLARLISDEYELCLTKCRTSSHSVIHENAYIDPNHKHCFGQEPPNTRPPD